MYYHVVLSCIIIIMYYYYYCCYYYYYYYLYSCYAEIHCGSLEAPTNGSVDSNSDIVDSVAKYSCDYGFRLRGSSQRTCLTSGSWDGDVATCDGQYPSYVPYHLFSYTSTSVIHKVAHFIID